MVCDWDSMPHKFDWSAGVCESVWEMWQASWLKFRNREWAQWRSFGGDWINCFYGSQNKYIFQIPEWQCLFDWNQTLLIKRSRSVDKPAHVLNHKHADFAQTKHPPKVWSSLFLCSFWFTWALRSVSCLHSIVSLCRNHWNCALDALYFAFLPVLL